MLFYLLLIAASPFVITAFPNLDNMPVEMAQFEPVVSKSNGKQEKISTTDDCSIPDDRNTECMLNCPMNRADCHPVCGTDGVTYINYGELQCMRHCGKNVQLLHEEAC